MMEKEIKLIKARIEDEIQNIDTLAEELKEKKLFPETSALEADKFFLRSIASILHDFYVAVENTLKTICSEIDEKLPDGPDWHMMLLKQATYDLPGIRPAIISKKTMSQLDKYRAFRHVFRNVYGFNLDPAKLRELLRELPNTIELFKAETQKFIKFLNELSRD
jgi:vacuolar-type H+-ATPase subunit E/Vma4